MTTANLLNRSSTDELTRLFGSAIVEVEAESSLNPKAVVAKVFLADGRTFRISSNSKLTKEQSFLLPRYLVRGGLTNKNWSVLEPTAFIDSERLLVYQHINGQTLRGCLDKIEVGVWFARIGQILRQIHNLPAPDFLSPIPAADFIGSYFSSGPTAEMTKAIIDRLAQAPADRIVHGDPNPSNFLVDQAADRLTLIDFSNAGIGDPMLDVAVCLVHCQLAGAPTGFEAAFWQGYGQVKPDSQARLRLWKALVYLHNVIYIENWLDANDSTRPTLIRARIEAAEKELGR